MMAAAGSISRTPTAICSKSSHVPTAADEWIEAGDLFAGTSNQPVNHRSANAHAQAAKHAKARLPDKHANARSDKQDDGDKDAATESSALAAIIMSLSHPPHIARQHGRASGRERESQDV